MGLICTSLHFKDVSQDRVVQAIRSLLPNHDCFVSPRIGDWVSVYDEECERRTIQGLVETVSTICRACECRGIVLNVLYGDLSYWLFNRQGELIDCSFPTGDAETTEEESAGLMGHPELLAELCRPGVTGADVRRVLSMQTVYRSENLEALAELLGLPQGNAATSHDFIIGEYPDLSEDTLEGWDRYVHVEGRQQ
jgi:hypothetical protein